ncbi:MAG: type II toxin-antitoxin system VapC family toxin [Hyphomonadaceae bacterium]
MVVIDASAMLTWCFADERAKNADVLLKRMVGEGMAAPSNFPLEVVNTLRVGERRKRITPPQAAAFIALVEALRIDIDLETPLRAWSDIRLLSLREELSAYDAAYLELALRRRAALATFDKGLLKAARANKVPVIEVGSPR